MTRLPEGKTRLDLVREQARQGSLGPAKRGRMVVSIDRLAEDPANERRTFRGLDELTASIKAVGIVEPITVTPAEGERFQIVTGHRRFRAAKAAGLTQVEVLIREPEDDRVRRQKSLVSNIQREDIGPVDMAEALRSLMDDDPRIQTQRDLAKLIGKPEDWVSGMLRILKLPAELRHKLGTSQARLSYDAVVRVARLDDGDRQAELVDAILNGATVRDIRDAVDEAAGRTPPSRRARPGSPLGGKPKQVYRTAFDATVIVQAETRTLGVRQTVASLEEALAKAKEAAD